MLRAWPHPCPRPRGLQLPCFAQLAHHLGWCPSGPQKPCGSTFNKGAIVTGDGDGKRRVGLAALPELARVLLQLALLGGVQPRKDGLGTPPFLGFFYSYTL